MQDIKNIEEKVIYEKLIKNICNGQDNSGIQSFIDSLGIEELTALDIIMLNKNFNIIHDNIKVLKSTENNSSQRQLNSSRKFIGGLVVFVKRIIRKLTRWYIEPVCIQQSSFNIAVTPIFQGFNSILIKLLSDIVLLNKNQNKLKDQYLIEITEIKNSHQLLEQELRQKIELVENNQYNANCKITEAFAKLSPEIKLGFDLFKIKSDNFWDKHTFSQSGEDSIISYILRVIGIPFNKCRYLDLGANHAKDLSNTYFLYTKGAQGVIVEANPQLIPELYFFRNRDKILNQCISVTTGDTVEFYILSGDGLSTPDFAKVQEFIQKNHNLRITETVQVETITVNDIFKNCFDETPEIMNIDIEGKDMEILQSIDFEKYRPFIIITEMIEYKTTIVVGEKNAEILTFMNSKNYVEYAFTGINSIFVDRIRLGE